MSYHFNLEPRDVKKIKTNNVSIVTKIPNPETLEIINRCVDCEPMSMNDQLPVVWDEAKGYQVYDKSGNCWIDFTSTIFVANVGHSNPKVSEAIKSAVDKNLLNAYYYQTGYRQELVEKLIEITPSKMNKVLLLSTGSEATEAAVKTCMNYGRRISSTKEIVIGFEGSFHGKTMGSQTLGGKDAGKSWIKNKQENIMHFEYPYPWVLKDLGVTGAQFFELTLSKLAKKGINPQDIAAVLAEPYQGWCAVFFPNDYMLALRKWCTEHNILLGFDEIQAGFGRTGEMFGYQIYDIEPDLIWCGKALSASIPVSAVIANEDFFGGDASLNSTHGGNPIGAAASVAVINYIQDNDLLARAKKQGELILKELEVWRGECPEYIHEIYGNGMVWAIFIRDPKTKELDVELVDKVIERAMEKGLLSIRTMSGTLKFGAPLVITDEALREGISILKDSLKELTA